jgi:hypothetical protein
MPRPPRITTTSSGAAIVGNPARVAFAQDSLLERSSGRTVKLLIERFQISRATAERDIATAKRLIAETAERQRPQIRALETVRLDRVADAAEQLVDKAMATGDYAAAAPAMRSVIAASREIGRLNGAYAPDKVEVTHGAEPELVLQIDAILAILTDAGRAAMDVVMGEIEAAKADGRLKLELDDGAGETLATMS